MSPGDRLFKLCYWWLRVLHWALFFVTLEIACWCTGWMLFGIVGNMFDAVLARQSGAELSPHFQLAGKAAGLLAGILVTYFAMGRYRRGAKVDEIQSGEKS
jgi:hypothetical protein